MNPTVLDFFVNDMLNKTVSENSLASLRKLQLKAINKTLALAGESSKFYKNRFSKEIGSFEEFGKLKTTSAEDLITNQAESFFSVSPQEILRMVTLFSSGSTGEPKRIGFTASELEMTTDFFAQGMLELAKNGDRVLIFMPGSSEYGVSQLLKSACEKKGMQAEIYGSIKDISDALNNLIEYKPNCIAGLPVQILELSEYLKDKNYKLKSVLLSADCLAETVRKRIENNLDCTVFNHYGTTEMGYGAALECSAHEGMHLREAELFFEVIDPLSGIPLPDGTTGELVFTTLQREGVPLIRYRTGDYTHFMKEKCQCGSFLTRIAPPYRKEGEVSMIDFDNILFRFEEIVDFSVNLNLTEKLINIGIWSKDNCEIRPKAYEAALSEICGIYGADVKIIHKSDGLSPSKLGKRLISKH